MLGIVVGFLEGPTEGRTEGAVVFNTTSFSSNPSVGANVEFFDDFEDFLDDFEDFEDFEDFDDFEDFLDDFEDLLLFDSEFFADLEDFEDLELFDSDFFADDFFADFELLDALLLLDVLDFLESFPPEVVALVSDCCVGAVVIWDKSLSPQSKGGGVCADVGAEVVLVDNFAVVCDSELGLGVVWDGSQVNDGASV
jgi:hypothetical protein